MPLYKYVSRLSGSIFYTKGPDSVDLLDLPLWCFWVWLVGVYASWEINPFTALTRIRSQFLRTQWSTSNHQRVDTTTPQTAQPSGLAVMFVGNGLHRGEKQNIYLHARLPLVLGYIQMVSRFRFRYFEFIKLKFRFNKVFRLKSWYFEIKNS